MVYAVLRIKSGALCMLASALLTHPRVCCRPLKLAFLIPYLAPFNLVLVFPWGQCTPGYSLWCALEREALVTTYFWYVLASYYEYIHILMQNSFLILECDFGDSCKIIGSVVSILLLR